MRFGVLATALSSAAGVFAASHVAINARHSEVALAKRICYNMPSGPDMEMVDRVYNTVRQRTPDETVMLVVFITVRQESYFNNLNCGDQESHGLVQQKAPGYGWGSVADTLNPEHAIGAFLDVLMPYYNSNRGLPANRYAQHVQAAEAGDLYGQHIGWAKGFIAQAKGRYEARIKAEEERKEKARQKSISISKSKSSVSASKSRASAEAKSRSKASVTSSIQASITSEIVASSQAAAAAASSSAASSSSAAAAAAAAAVNVGSAPKTMSDNAFAPEETGSSGASARVAFSGFAIIAAVVVAML